MSAYRDHLEDMYLANEKDREALLDKLDDYVANMAQLLANLQEFNNKMREVFRD